jgi:hypothetical protein
VRILQAESARSFSRFGLSLLRGFDLARFGWRRFRVLRGIPLVVSTDRRNSLSYGEMECAPVGFVQQDVIRPFNCGLLSSDSLLF